MANRMKERYVAEIAPALNKKFGYKSVMQIPKLSKVMLVCPKCGKATRVGHKTVDGKNVRACKKCGATS